jgi:putrescine transport system permease protein
MKSSSRTVVLATTAVLLFLYLPMLILIVYSFNGGRFVTVWGGASVKWYGVLFANSQVISAALLSLQIAAVSASVATAIGVMAGYSLARFKLFPCRVLFAILMIAPILMPEVITGMSLLLLFVESEKLIGWPTHRGILTVIISHITFTLPCAALVMRARFKELDVSLEEAALDLGARPFKTLWAITLPLALPAVAASWLLCFTISLDDLVITTFVNGPGSTTLPQFVFSKVRVGVDPSINALAVIIIAIALFSLLVSLLATRRTATPSS